MNSIWLIRLYPAEFCNGVLSIVLRLVWMVIWYKMRTENNLKDGGCNEKGIYKSFG